MAQLELSGAETVAFSLLLLVCLATLPPVVAHVRGRSSRIDDVARMMASTERFQARLAGGMHLTWANVFFGSAAVVLNATGASVASVVAGLVFMVAMLLDLAVFATGRPSAVVVPRHRESAVRR